MKQSFKQKYAIFLKTSSRVSRLLWGVQTWMLDQIVRQDVDLLMHRSVFEKKKSLWEGVNLSPQNFYFLFFKKLSDEVSQNFKWSLYYCRGFNSGENCVFRMFLRCTIRLEIKFLYEGVSPKKSTKRLFTTKETKSLLAKIDANYSKFF